MDVWPPKRQGKQRRNDGPQPGGTVSLHKPDAEEDHRRGDTLHFHGPHDRVDIGADHEHVQNHVAGSEVTFVGHIDSEPLMQCREQGNDSDGGREKPKNAMAEVAGWIGIGFEGSRQDEAADDKESHDGAGAVGKPLEATEYDSVPAGAGCIRELAPNVGGNDGQGRDPAQRFKSRNEAHFGTLASRARAQRPPVGLDNPRAGRQRPRRFIVLPHVCRCIRTGHGGRLLTPARRQRPRSAGTRRPDDKAGPGGFHTSRSD